MGLFGELFREIASEIGTAIVDGFNEANEREEEKKSRIAELEEICNRSSLDDLRYVIENEDNPEFYTDEYKEIAQKNISSRKTLVMQAKNGNLKQILTEYADEELLQQYINLRDNGESLFEKDAKVLFSAYYEELIKRPGAVRIYEEDLHDSYEEDDFDDLIKISNSREYTYDRFIKYEVKHEIEKRLRIVESINPEDLAEMDNADFMELYDTVRRDKTRWYFDDDVDELISYNSYFGKYRTEILRVFENEISEERQYLVEAFINEYCEEEIEEYNNYSNKKLKEIISWNIEDVNEENYYSAVDYDEIDKIIAAFILKKRIG